MLQYSFESVVTIFVPAVRRTWLEQPFKDVWRLDFFQQAATLPLAADDGNAEESIAWLSDVADVSGMLHEASYRLWEQVIRDAICEYTRWWSAKQICRRLCLRHAVASLAASWLQRTLHGRK